MVKVCEGMLGPTTSSNTTAQGTGNQEIHYKIPLDGQCQGKQGTGCNCKTMGYTIEMTAPHTPQMNGVVECVFAVCAANGRAMIAAANLSNNMKQLLWAECFNTVSILGNLTPIAD